MNLSLVFFILSLVVEKFQGSEIIKIYSGTLRNEVSLFFPDYLIGLSFSVSLEADCLVVFKRKEKTIEQPSVPISRVINHSNFMLDVFERNQDIKFGNSCFVNLSYYYTDNPEIYHKIYSKIPLAFQFKDEKFSVVHSLYLSKRIPKLAFGFGENNEVMYFGGLPKNETYNKYKASCRVNNSFSYWNCKLDYVFLGNKFDNQTAYVSSSEEVVFNTDEYYIMAPKSFIKYLRKHIFDKAIKDKKCGFNSASIYSFFYCDCEAINDFGVINLVFDKTVFSINMSQLFGYFFDATANMLLCDFYINLNKKNEHQWKFGKTFIEKFTTLFDYEEGRIEFYSGRKFKAIDESLTKKFYVCSIIVDCLISVFLLYIKKARKIG